MRARGVWAKPVTADAAVADAWSIRRRRLAVSVLAAFVFLAAFGLIGRAQASTVSGFTATASTHSAGATAVEYSVGFTATSALTAHTDHVQLTGPAGSTLSTSAANYSVTVTGTGASGPKAAFSVTAGGTSNVVDVDVPDAVAAGDGVHISAYEASNPTSANPGATFSVSTSQDTTAPTPVAFGINMATAVSGVSASSTSPTAGSQEVEDTVTFTANQPVVYANNNTFPTQCLDGECNQGDIILTAPAGTVFDAFDQDYSITDVTTGMADSFEVNGASTGPSNVVTLAPSFTINAGDHVQVVAYEVQNPSSPVPSGTMSVSTTSDTTATSTPFPIGASSAVTSAVVATNSTTAGASDPEYLVGLTTTHALPFFNDGSDGTGWAVLTFPSAATAVGDTVFVSDAAHPTPLSTSSGEFGRNPSADQVDVSMPFAVPAGTALTITLSLSTNPTPFSYPVVSTSADASAISAAAPTGVTATAGNASAGLSWTAAAAPFGATLTDSVITPFIGATAQAPFDTASTASSTTVPGLTNGTSYAFEVGETYSDNSTTYNGPRSSASNTVTPSTASGGPGAATAFSAGSLSFGLGFTGQATPAQTVTLFNVGSLPLQVSGVSLTGTGAPNVTVTADHCASTSVAAGGSCTVSVAFTAKATSGIVSASLSFTDNASGSPQTVALSGTATNAGYVSGRVYDSTKSSHPGLPGSVVDMCLNGSVRACYNGSSDSSGNYTVGPMPAGKYIVTVSSGTLNVVDATYDAVYNVVTGRATNDIGLPEPQEFPSSVTLTGTTLGTEHFLEADDPATVLFRPHFPTEPAGTEIAYLITSAVSSLYNQVTASQEVLSKSGVTYTSGAIVLIVSYGAGGTPTVIGQYPDASSGASPTVTLSATSPGSSTSDSASSGILDQYLSTGEIQSVIPPIPHILWTQISNEPSYYIVSRSNASVDVRAVGPHIVIGAIPPPLNSGSATDLACSACGDEYFDPSGTVESTKGIPLKSAKVTLLQSKSAKGRFTAVPNGSSVMSSQNRKDPFQTNVLGSFGWDTVPGFYRVTASHAGCTAVPRGKVAETRVYDVPPPVDGIVIKLKCPHLKRSASHLKLKITSAKRGTFIATAKVNGRNSPTGNVTFKGPGLHAVLPLNGKHQAQIVLLHVHESVTVNYSGDALNAPSRARAHSR
jgi:hypothetical protein